MRVIGRTGREPGLNPPFCPTITSVLQSHLAMAASELEFRNGERCAYAEGPCEVNAGEFAVQTPARQKAVLWHSMWRAK